MVEWHKRLAPIHWLALYCLIIIVWSVWGVADFGVWVFEIWVGLLGLAILLLTAKRFPFSNLVYVLVGVHFTVLALGAHYTYAEMPLFNWLRDTFHLARNHFDRVGHFMQGFTPAIVAREILLRTTRLQPGKMIGFLSICVPFALSAFWEILEMAIVLLFYKSEGMGWLGVQGDIWDAQWDMTMCLIGATLAVLLLSRLHDKSIEKALAGQARRRTS